MIEFLINPRKGIVGRERIILCALGEDNRLRVIEMLAMGSYNPIGANMIADTRYCDRFKYLSFNWCNERTIL